MKNPHITRYDQFEELLLIKIIFSEKKTKKENILWTVWELKIMIFA